MSRPIEPMWEGTRALWAGMGHLEVHDRACGLPDGVRSEVQDHDLHAGRTFGGAGRCEQRTRT